MAKKVGEYTKRAEELKTVLHPPNISNSPTQTKNSTETKISATNISVCDAKPSLLQPTLVSSKLSSTDLRKYYYYYYEYFMLRSIDHIY